MEALLKKKRTLMSVLYNNNNNNNNDFIVRNGKSKNLFAQLIVGPAATEQRQVDVALSLSMLNAKQGSSNSHLLTSFGMTRPGIEPTTSRLWGGRSTDWANTHRFKWTNKQPGIQKFWNFAVTIKISMTKYDHWIKGQAYHLF